MADGSPSDASPGRALRTVLETELESVLQSVFAARQDVLDADREPSLIVSAERTLQGCATTLQLLLAVLRAVPGDRATWQVPVDRMSSAFCVMRPTGEMLYVNAEAARLSGRGHQALVSTPVEDRTWTDREQMRRHLAEAHDAGRVQEEFLVLRGDGERVPMTFLTERIDVEGSDPVLLMSHVRPGTPPAPHDGPVRLD